MGYLASDMAKFIQVIIFKSRNFVRSSALKQQVEAKKFITWGIHVFRSDDTDLDASKANVLYDYLDEQIEKVFSGVDEEIYRTKKRQNRVGWWKFWVWSDNALSLFNIGRR